MTTEQHEAIRRHGEQLLAIYPRAKVTDPVLLCLGLRRLEKRAGAIALRLCNGPEFEGGEEEVDGKCAHLLGEVDRLLNFTEAGPMPFVNRDPRGYALKIRSGDMEAGHLALHQDWGGYGIIAPEIKADGSC